jgi:hypothetical protein
MSKEVKHERSFLDIIKSRFFFQIYCIPTIIGIVMSLLAMIPDDVNTKPIITWSELILIDIFLILIWFIISYFITTIELDNYNKLMKKYVKKITSKKEKSLFNCTFMFNCQEYIMMTKYFKRFYWILVFRSTIINIIFNFLIYITFNNQLVAVILFILIEVYLLISYNVRSSYFAEKNYKKLNNDYLNDGHYINIDFYEKYFIIQGETNNIYNINYKDIDKCIETDTRFYLENKDLDLIVIIQKDECSLKLINFIRSRFSNIINCLGDCEEFTGVKEYDHPSFIKNGMLILFIFNILSLLGVLLTFLLVNTISPKVGFNFIKNMWVCFIWLPIPIISTVLGYKYHDAGFKCTKNIISGFIIGFILIALGSLCFIPSFEEDYKEIDNYKEIISIDLPKDGILEVENWGKYFENDKSNYKIININYSKNDKNSIKKLDKNIKNSDKWILSTSMKSYLKILQPTEFKSNKNLYYSIYNKTTNQYNVLPDEYGKYEIYAMKYDISSKKMVIHNFNYNYK